MIILPDALYNPNFKKNITSDTRLGPGITVAKFLGAPGDRTSFNFITTNDERKKIARHLYLHAELIRLATENTREFANYRLIVSEGIYKPYKSSYTSSAATGEKVTPGSLNDLKSNGRAAAYQLIGSNGKPSHSKTFDLAAYWKDYAMYDRLILDYDTYSPDGSLSCQIVVVVPELSSSFQANFAMNVETRYNSQKQDEGLVEILE